MTKVCIVCSERNGSNLLKAILNQVDEIFISPPIPMYECFNNIIDSYGDLLEDDNWRLLCGDVVRLINVNHQPIPEKISQPLLLKLLERRGRDLGHIINVVYEHFARIKEAKIAGCKYSSNMSNLFDFLQLVGIRKVIYQVRDPRDVVLSRFKNGFQEDDPLESGKNWRDDQLIIESVLNSIPCDVFRLTYEDLISEPLKKTKEIGDFLGLNVNSISLDFYNDPLNINAATSSHMWANLNRPVMKENSHKYYSEWNYSDVRKIEKIIGKETLAKFGYKMSNLFLYKSLFRKKPNRRLLTESDHSFYHDQEKVWNEMNKMAEVRRRVINGVKA